MFPHAAYYPFGLKHGRYNTPARDYRPIGEERDVLMVGDNPYKYKHTGKELQDELGLNVYDFGTRFYMPDIGRWGQIDPLAIAYNQHSPYNYSLNNPIYFIDPDGMWVKGAGFWRNITSSDARIHAEDFASENEGTVVKGGSGTSRY